MEIISPLQHHGRDFLVQTLLGIFYAMRFFEKHKDIHYNGNEHRTSSGRMVRACGTGDLRGTAMEFGSQFVFGGLGHLFGR